jgi:hypothetical protein
MLDPSIGFNSAVNGYNSTSTSSGEKNTAEKPTVESLRYPYNMKIDRDTDYLELTIAEYQPPGFGSGKANELVSNNNTILGGTPEEQSKNANQLLSFGNLPTGGLNTKNTKYYIMLPIPQAISDTTSVSWGPDTLDPLSAFAVGLGDKLIQENFNLSKVGQDLINKATNLGIDQKTKNAIIAAVSTKAYGALGGNVSVSGIVARASGRVFNPNLELLFNGVNLRSFPFTFDFAPRNQTEARIVKKIIRAFKKSMTAKSSSQNQFGGVFIGAPDVFQITYKRGKDPHPFLNKFKPMALTDMQLNYTGSNTYTTYADGTPVHIQMSLTFTELSPVYNVDYKEDDIGVGF